MSRPMTLPPPWNELASQLGGVGALAKALGTVPRTVNDWVNGNRVPRGPAWCLIQRVFHENGLQPPEKPSSAFARPIPDARKFLDEIAAGFAEYQCLLDDKNDGFQWLTRVKAVDALARVEAAGIGLERAVCAVLIQLASAQEKDAFRDAVERCRAFQIALDGPAQALLMQVTRGVGPGDPRRIQILQSLQSRCAESLGYLRDVLRDLEDSQAQQQDCRDL